MPIQIRYALIAFILVCGTLTGCHRAPEEAPATLEPAASESEAAYTLPSREDLLAQARAALAQAAQTQGSGSPALWRLSDADTDIYMFGTVHLLKPDLDWRSDAVNAAFKAAGTIVFELDTDSPEAQAKLMTDFMSRGFYKDGRTLSAVLNDEIETVVRTAFDGLGVPFSAIDVQEPWMAAMNLSMMKMVSDGFHPESGVEAVFQTEAEAAGKSFAFLEDVKDQADAFDLLPEAEQIEMLYGAALMLDESSRMLDVLVEEWADGDARGLAVLAASPDAASMSERVYEALLVNRNAKWVPQIETMLETPGTVFIAVGAAHLVGPDSVVAMLRARGHEIEGP